MGLIHRVVPQSDASVRSTTLVVLIVPVLALYVIFSVESMRARECAEWALSVRTAQRSLSPPTMSSVSARPGSAPSSASMKGAKSARDSIELPQCARSGERATSFLMVFMGHSGSSAIISELGAHSQVYFENGEPVDHFEYERNTTLALKWTRDFFARGIAAGRTPGFKLRPTHILNQPAKWASLVAEFDTRIIWQYRENIFKKSIGEYTNRYLNDTSVVEGLRRNMTSSERCKIGAGCRFRVENFDYFHALLQDSAVSDVLISRAVHQILNGRSCVHALPYENYLYDRVRTMQHVHHFLGLRQESHPPLRYKATNDNLCEAVENWDDVCRNFYGCHAWRRQMDDERNGCRCRFASGPVRYCAVDYPLRKL